MWTKSQEASQKEYHRLFSEHALDPAVQYWGSHFIDRDAEVGGYMVRKPWNQGLIWVCSVCPRS